MTDNRTIRLSELETAIRDSLVTFWGAGASAARRNKEAPLAAFNDEAKRLTNIALSALPAVEGWLPIESAPKDGARVLLYDKFNREQAFARFVGAFGDYGWSSIPGAYGKNPTHWQPLPAPPIE